VTSIIKRTLDMIQAPIKRRQAIRIEKQKELDILFGEQDALDILSYAGLEENIDYLCIAGIGLINCASGWRVINDIFIAASIIIPSVSVAPIIRN
jgi:hypothetical protein